MPVAAVPRYLPANQFSQASPALRYGLLLSIWTERRDQEQEVLDRAQRRSPEARQLQQALGPNNQNLAVVTDRLIQQGKIPALWVKNDAGARAAWSIVQRLNRNDVQAVQGWNARLRRLAASLTAECAWSCEAAATAPFTTGLGNEHPLENGFSFLNPYGLPYLPGSGVKGVVREAARQLAGGEWEDSRGWDMEPVGSFKVPVDGEKREIALTALDVLFGRETPEGESEHFRGVLSFWDVIPEIHGDQLRVEVMTPHQSHYYQQKREKKSGDSTAPHDSGQPTPILFLTVPPGSKFHFVVTCDVPRLHRVAPGLADGDKWKKLLEAAFEHAFEWLGFGAKTAVGYGAMRRTATAASQPSAPSGAAGQRNTATAAAQVTQQIQVWENATLKWNPGKQELTALAAGKPSAAASQKKSQELLAALPEELRDQLKTKKTLTKVRVRVSAEGNKFTLEGLEG